jgi:hypothetical protein
MNNQELEASQNTTNITSVPAEIKKKQSIVFPFIKEGFKGCSYREIEYLGEGNFHPKDVASVMCQIAPDRAWKFYRQLVEKKDRCTYINPKKAVELSEILKNGTRESGTSYIKDPEQLKRIVGKIKRKFPQYFSAEEMSQDDTETEDEETSSTSGEINDGSVMNSQVESSISGVSNDPRDDKKKKKIVLEENDEDEDSPLDYHSSSSSNIRGGSSVSRGEPMVFGGNDGAAINSLTEKLNEMRLNVKWVGMTSVVSVEDGKFDAYNVIKCFTRSHRSAWSHLPDDIKCLFSVGEIFGKGGRKIGDIRSTMLMLCHLPSAKGILYWLVELALRYFAGDKTLIEEIRRNASSDAPINQLSREAIGIQNKTADDPNSGEFNVSASRSLKRAWDDEFSEGIDRVFMGRIKEVLAADEHKKVCAEEKRKIEMDKIKIEADRVKKESKINDVKRRLEDLKEMETSGVMEHSEIRALREQFTREIKELWRAPN